MCYRIELEVAEKELVVDRVLLPFLLLDIPCTWPLPTLPSECSIEEGKEEEECHLEYTEGRKSEGELMRGCDGK